MNRFQPSAVQAAEYAFLRIVSSLASEVTTLWRYINHFIIIIIIIILCDTGTIRCWQIAPCKTAQMRQTFQL